MTGRTADSTIKGFLYQFNKTLLEVTQADDDEIITVEGLVEDVDIYSADGSLKAIQCKYHESQDKFTGSLIYKPLLQMAEAFSKNSKKDIMYTIFLHVPTETIGVRNVEKDMLDEAMATDNQSLIKIVARIENNFDADDFLKNVKIEFGTSIDELEVEVKKSLGKYKLSGSDIDTLLYPNAITKISKLSSLKSEADRKISNDDLRKYLSSVTTTAISKWTLSLKNRKEILNKTKKQLINSFSQNSRERCFYFDIHEIEEFEERIVVFIGNYLDKYHSKPSHLKTPIFAMNIDFASIKDIQYRLFKKGIKANTGLVGDVFEVDSFYKDPIQIIQKSKIENREFDLRLLALSSEQHAINHRKGDDLYLVCSSTPECIETTDINHFQVGTTNFNELEYVVSLRNSHE
jgi:hypothetical protein